MLKSAPTLNRPRSSWSCSPRSDISFRHGELVPARCWMVVPGDHFKVNVASLIQMNTPKQAFADEIEYCMDAYYVPMRLTWNHFEEFMGANKTGAGAQLQTFLIPQRDLTGNGVKWDSLSRYLGKPVTPDADIGYYRGVFASILKERGYYLIYNNYYRASMIQNPVVVDTTDGDAIAVGKATDSPCMQVCKARDYITMALKQPLYGVDSVSLPLGTSAPVYFKNPGSTAIPANSTLTVNAAGIPAGGLNTYIMSNGKQVDAFADLSDAAAAPIDSVRYALATEAFLHNANYGGSTYWGQNLAHYGVSPSDKSLAIPQLLGSIKFDLNVSSITQVAANTDSDGVTTPLGATGAISRTGHNEFLFSHDFEEFGFVYCLCYTRVKKQSYAQHLKREDFIKSRLEFFSPEFNNIGDDILYNKEVYLSTGASTYHLNDGVFGYQEHDAYLKYFMNESAGIFTPGVAGVSDDTWTFTNNFTSLPQLNASFVTEDRNLVASKLITGTQSNFDYLAFFQFDMSIAREVSVISDPTKLL